jgi:hypothetical protein
MKGYIEAVKYVSYRLMGMSVIDSYQMTFPDRYQRLMDKYLNAGLEEEEIRSKKISPYATIYNKGNLVNEIMGRALVPVSILNADLFQSALNVQADLMLNARSETVKQLASKTVLEILKPAETTKIELDVGLKENNVISELRQTTMELAKQQQLSIESGVITATKVAEDHIIEVTMED